MSPLDPRVIVWQAGMVVDDRPWLILTAARLLRDPDDMYADYSAWEEWMRRSLPESEGECWWFDEDEDYLARIDLYGAHCDMVDSLP